MAQTLYDKLWDAHVVHQESDGTCMLYIDRHLLHEVTSPQAFEGLALAGRQPWRVGANLAVADHNVPTLNRAQGIEDPISRLQVDTLDDNCAKYGITEFRMNDLRQGIVHVIGPEQGATLPGMTVVCGDSHTSTHGALGALAFGIGTSEVEHVLATQTLLMKKAKSMQINVEGELPFGCTAKDVVLHIIGIIGTAGGTGHAIDHVRDWVLGSNGKWVTMGIPSDGSYGIPEGIIYGFPVVTENGEYKMIKDLEIDAFSRERLDFTLKELLEERDGVKDLLK